AGTQAAMLVAVEGHSEVLEVEDLLRRLAAHDLDRVLVAQVVGALDGVEGVGLPGVVLLEGGVDAALRRVRVRAHGVDLGDDGDVHAGLRGRQGRPLSRQSGAYDQYVVLGHAWGADSMYGGRARLPPCLRSASPSPLPGSSGWGPGSSTGISWRPTMGSR